MIKIFAFIVISVSFAQKKQPESFSVLQKQIIACGVEVPNIKKISSFQDLYKALDKKYLLLSESTIEREITYHQRFQYYKIKVNNDEISHYTIDEERKVTPAPLDAKQKMLTNKARIQQLLLNAKIDDDWGQYFERREQGVQIEYSIRDLRNMTKLKVDFIKSKQSLDCKIANDAEVCTCSKIATK